MLKIIPDAYPRDPLLWAANQSGHTMMGAVAAFDVSWLWFHVAGEYPYRIPVIVALSLTYLVWVELLGQGWQGADTVEDAGFFASGAALMLYPFSEVVPSLPDVTVNPVAFGAILFGWQAYMLGGMIGRGFNRMRAGMHEE